MTKAPLFAILLAACSTTVTPPPAPGSGSSSSEPQPGTFTVTGTASIDVTPDTADLHVTLVGHAQRPGAAARQAREQENRFVGALGKIGVETKDVKLDQLNINPSYDDKGRINGYDASIDVVATTHDFDKVGNMMEAAADAGASNMSSSFHADLPKMKAKARDMALAAAQDKAKQIAADLGIATGKVVAVVEDPGSPYGGYYGVANAEADVARAPNVNLPPSANTLELSISVTYQISGGGSCAPPPRACRAPSARGRGTRGTRAPARRAPSASR